jgi:hypothetical protein
MSLEYQVMTHKFATNPWTEVRHGHSRTELKALKILLLENKQNCSILSESREFGDYFTKPKNLSVDSKILNKNPFYTLIRFLNNYRFFYLNIQEFKNLSEPEDELIISSVNFEQFLIASIFFGNNSLHIRVFNCPEGNLTKFKKFLLNGLIKAKKFTIGTETKEIANWFENNLNLATQIVPPLNLIRRDDNSNKEIYIKYKKPIIGIIYPVTSTFKVDEFREICDIFSTEKLLVKFPTLLPTIIATDNLEVIQNGISDEQLINCITRMDFIVLMNRDYLNRGSGLLTLCMSLGKNIYVFEDNNFVETYKESYPLISIRNSKDIEEHYKLNKHNQLEPESRLKLGRAFVDNTKLRWESFLDIR